MIAARTYLVALSVLLLLASCTSIKPATIPDKIPAVPEPFSHDELARVLDRYVDDQGFVDYSGLNNGGEHLERYYLLLSTYSPDSHPSLFPTEQSSLAYWLNAYNATVIKAVLTHYPISSVKDIRPPLPLFFLPDVSGFFLFQRVTLGGKATSLYHLENGVIRKRFKDPRVHFALNCAARGCPRLPKKPFTAAHLDEQLDHETRKFLTEERNLRVDHQKKTVYLSSIFDWYESDFLDWYRERFPGRKATLLNYVILYLPAEKAEEFTGQATLYQMRFIPYDWSLNDQDGQISVVGN